MCQVYLPCLYHYFVLEYTVYPHLPGLNNQPVLSYLLAAHKHFCLVNLLVQKNNIGAEFFETE